MEKTNCFRRRARKRLILQFFEDSDLDNEVTLKTRSKSLNHITSSFCRCNLENKVKFTKVYLCKFGQNPSHDSEDNAQKRSYMDAKGIRTKNNISFHPSGLGDIKMFQERERKLILTSIQIHNSVLIRRKALLPNINSYTKFEENWSKNAPMD